MRAVFFLIVGALSGFALQNAIAQSRTPDIVAVNHVGMNVPNLAECGFKVLGLVARRRARQSHRG